MRMNVCRELVRIWPKDQIRTTSLQNVFTGYPDSVSPHTHKLYLAILESSNNETLTHRGQLRYMKST